MRRVQLLLSPAFLVLLFAHAEATAASFVVPPDEVLVEWSEAVVWGTVQSTYSERNDRGAIQTVSIVTVDEVLKGVVASKSVRIVEPGGVLDGMAMTLTGTPQYEPGARVLVLLRKDRKAEWTTTDLVLGKFELATTARGEKVLIREEGKIAGWDRAGNVYGGSDLRKAEAFLEFVRLTVAGARPMADYFLPGSRDVEVSAFRADVAGQSVSANTVFTAGQYVVHYNIGTLKPIRWKHDADSLNGSAPVAPWPDMKDGVIWKIDASNLQDNLTGGGVTQTQQALAAWTDDCGSLVKYTYGGPTATEVRLNGGCTLNGSSFSGS